MSNEQQFQSFLSEIEQTTNQKAVQILDTLSRFENDCFTSAKDDSDKFVKCMTSSMKKLEKEEKRLEYKMAFFQVKTAECFRNAGTNAAEIQKCKENGKADIDKYFNDFINNIK